jgi:hypothetical protein
MTDSVNERYETNAPAPVNKKVPPRNRFRHERLLLLLCQTTMTSSIE